MKALGRSPWWLVVASVALAGQVLTLFVGRPSLVGASAIAVAAALLTLMLSGSRFAWTVVLIGAVGQIVNAVSSSEYDLVLAALGCLVSICLLVPSSVRFVWRESSHRQPGRLRLAVAGPYARIKVSAYGAFASLAAWEDGEFRSDSVRKRRSYRMLIWHLGVGCVLLLLLLGVVHSLRPDAGGDSAVINVIARVTWICYALVQLTFIGVVLIAIYQHLFPGHRAVDHDSSPRPQK